MSGSSRGHEPSFPAPDPSCASPRCPEVGLGRAVDGEIGIGRVSAGVRHSAQVSFRRLLRGHRACAASAFVYRFRRKGCSMIPPCEDGKVNPRPARPVPIRFTSSDLSLASDSVSNSLSFIPGEALTHIRAFRPQASLQNSCISVAGAGAFRSAGESENRCSIRAKSFPPPALGKGIDPSTHPTVPPCTELRAPPPPLSQAESVERGPSASAARRVLAMVVNDRGHD